MSEERKRIENKMVMKKIEVGIGNEEVLLAIVVKKVNEVIQTINQTVEKKGGQT